MLFKFFIGKASGMALIWLKKKPSFLLPKRYYGLWLKWVRGGRILLNDKKRIHWVFPRISFRSMRTPDNMYPKLRHRY